MYERYKHRGVELLGVMTDNPSESELLNFMSDFQLTYPVISATSDIMLSFNYPQALPTTFVYNKRAKLVYSHVGPLSEDALAALLDQYVAEN